MPFQILQECRQRLVVGTQNPCPLAANDCYCIAKLHVWDVGDSLWTNAVDVHIKYLRDKIERPFDTAMITTVHGVGNMREAPPKMSAEQAGEPR